ncbi:MAG: type 2 isopentenyl-diphosphate Delta-isomerase [Bacteroidota bacterium]|nr:type 2 isopentenyl-diphosphate Delta-isomerase [Candidatus Kapabacteria bacterium]MDW8220680.1 type 2 isopentenyl-diphosphate Delta-isomerase [Bacteroidota bacterium]
MMRMASDMQNTSSRKQEHVELCVRERVSFRTKTSGFESISLPHNALPELDFDEVCTQTTFLGKSIAMPVMISSMTGGYADAERINCALAEVCASLAIPMGVGSQRQALEQSDFHASFRIARQVAPRIPLAANIGAAEITQPHVREKLHMLVDMIEADALIIHLNPLQELLQPEGSPRFRGVLRSIEAICRTIGVPIIVKEVGAGLHADVMRRLFEAGVTILDVAGAGGTSWAGVEILRSPEHQYKEVFWDWGMSTVECLLQAEQLRRDYPAFREHAVVIASGGITSGLDVAKALALGAHLAAAARPVLQTLVDQGQYALESMLRGWQFQLRGAMFLTGCATIPALRALTCLQHM